ncbi:LemA family protein [Estrella lausannensis]|uniref:Putative membrane protein n=1 Tax=Estrella lausannensis TaxID=483423 RepID=A0A0H5DR58_9BACT|nr:LemA family protein [Estrella lausannensis]CRX38124.1 putative membrane protein [Estrella lausannensis]
MTFGIIILIVAAVVLFWLISIYNNLVKLKNQVKNAWGQIDVQLQRRYDLIPNLVETVKGYMSYEKSTLEAVIEARSKAMGAMEAIHKQEIPSGQAMKELMSAETVLQGALPKIFALAENYPQLRASENMAQLQEELRTTENQVAFSRQSYNDQAMQYNITQEQFPTLIFAKMFGHVPADIYKVEQEEAKKAVKVSFN